VTAPTSINWTARLRQDPLDWLLDDEAPAVRHLALRWLLDRPRDDVDVLAARQAAMTADPIAAILAAQHPSGYWAKPGPGYSPKYRATVWQLIFFDQLGADPADARVRAACEYVLAHTQAASGGFLASGCKEGAPPPPERVIHCLTGNLLRALLGFGWADDPRVQQAIDWQARAITGDEPIHYSAFGTTGPGFACVANEGQPFWLADRWWTCLQAATASSFAGAVVTRYANRARNASGVRSTTPASLARA
jgi:hypothetical protein